MKAYFSFDVFRRPGFAFYCLSNFTMRISMAIQQVVLGWLVYEITGSLLLLGMTTALRMIPMVLGMVVGVIADLVNRRKLLIAIISTQVIIAFLMGTLILLGEVKYFHILLFSVADGLLFTFTMPVREAYITELVVPHELTNAISFNMIFQTAATFIGPSLIGTLGQILNVASFFYLTGVFHVMGIIFIFMIPQKTANITRNNSIEHSSALRELREGSKYVWNNRLVLSILFITACGELFGYGFISLMPVFARDVLKVGESGLGWLNAAYGLGSLIISVSMSLSKDVQKKGWLLFLSHGFWGLTLLAFSMSKLFSLSLLFLFGMGLAWTMALVMITALLLANTSENMRGRVLGLRWLLLILDSVSHTTLGMVSSVFGAPLALGVSSALLSISVFGTLLCLPKIRKL